MPTRRIVLALIATLVTGNLLAYSAEVQKVDEFPRSFARLAMLPAAGPPGFETIWLENLLSDRLTQSGVPVVPSARVREAMSDLGIVELTGESRRVLARSLGVDAFITATVDAASMGTSTSYSFMGLGRVSLPFARNVGSVRLVIVSADTEERLMEGSGRGESVIRSRRGVIARSFDGILDRVFNAEFQSQRQR